MASDSQPALRLPSLIVKLPYGYCTKCADALQRWCEPGKPFEYRSGRMDTYDSSFNYVLGLDYFLREKGNSKLAQWLWHISDLKVSARHCRCCNFILKTLNASPWMVYEDEDFVILKSQLVGSTLSGILATPQERDSIDRNNLESKKRNNHPTERYSKYDRFHRPMLELCRRRIYKGSQSVSHLAGDFTFILPLAQPENTSSNNILDSQIFHGRIVAAEVHIPLIQQWLRTCNAKHIKSDKSSNLDIWREDRNEDCVPKPRRKFSHFRLVDVKKRCVVLAQDEDEYAALSYVWGRAKRLLLTIKNLELLSTPGALSPNREEVPRTFKDALDVAERLNIAFLWIDALCVLQDNEDQLVEHMNVMDSIYSSAILTIVSDTNSADSGIPGISIPRDPPQVTLKHGTKTYISTKLPFGRALSDSCWESRAWCLQEKVFSRRLLVFTGTQAFYHCISTTWFEDTIMELREHNHASVSIAEQARPSSKRPWQPGHTAYEAHQKNSSRSFWSLIEVYTQRQLSFESDSIRAFSGILNSLESEYGPAHWGVPEYYFARGITWSQSQHKLGYRRPQFPSWSWAGWRGNTGSKIHFNNVRMYASDIWHIDWHIHKLNKQTGAYDLTPTERSYTRTWTVAKSVIRRPKHEPRSEKTRKLEPPEANECRKDPLPEPLSCFPDEEPAGDWRELYRSFRERAGLGYIWALPGHPSEEDYLDREMPAFEHDPVTMPPLSHIVRFFTSCAKLFIDTEPDSEYHNQHHYLDKDNYFNYYAFRSPSIRKPLGHVQLDPAWEGKGKEQEFVFVSPGFWPPSDSDSMGEPPIIIWIMLVEDLEGASEVKRRVQLYGPMDISTWRLAEPTHDEIESQVVVEFEAAFVMEEHTNKGWGPELETLIGSKDSDQEKADQKSCEADCSTGEYVYNDSYVEDKMNEEFMGYLLPKVREEMPSVVIIPRPLDTKAPKAGLTENDLVIMSYRVFGFVLRNRKWAQLDLTHLSEVQPSGTKDENNKRPDEDLKAPAPAFNQLVLPPGHKDMILSLITQHFRDKELNHNNQADIVRGKGKGLILLLHGAPGVGKTTTAEGVAEKFKKPLFQLTCGDLETTAKDVESALETNFALANRWGCLLLLDEADVFLAQRTKEDFKRNGLVAVFLKVLEYYAGILFLTTNRVGDFDEAFASRIHISLYYPELGRKETLAVFKLNLQLIRDRFKGRPRKLIPDEMEIGAFAQEYWDKNPFDHWNGRQIRNACQTALALAEYEAQGQNDMVSLSTSEEVHLNVSHFKTVADAYLAFSKHLRDIYGTHAARRGKEAGLRAMWVNEKGEVMGNIGPTEAGVLKLDRKSRFRYKSQSRYTTATYEQQQQVVLLTGQAPSYRGGQGGVQGGGGQGYNGPPPPAQPRPTRPPKYYDDAAVSQQYNNLNPQQQRRRMVPQHPQGQDWDRYGSGYEYDQQQPEAGGRGAYPQQRSRLDAHHLKPAKGGSSQTRRLPPGDRAPEYDEPGPEDNVDGAQYSTY
ncbi:hypothetical protein HD806DRAFT_533834 [Xylariaceae sp. AK1471]|nr:hypothetical protein HD806DRAFT_533834 [Xylariaceae sp. AK1471]